MMKKAFSAEMVKASDVSLSCCSIGSIAHPLQMNGENAGHTVGSFPEHSCCIARESALTSMKGWFAAFGRLAGHERLDITENRTGILREHVGF